MAFSKLFSDVELISTIRAMDINSLLAVAYIKWRSVPDEYEEYKVGPCCSLNGCPKPLDKMLSRQRQVEGKIRGGNAFAVIFFRGWFTSFLLGVLAKTGARTWFFDGEFVVDCW